MSTETDDSEEAGGPELDADAAELDELRARVEELEDQLAAVETEVDDGEKSMVIIATKGTLDMAYPPLILASTAAAFGWDVTVFHTFWGLDILHEDHSTDLQMSSVGNPNTPVPNAIASLPGMDRVTTRLMRKRIADNETASVQELLDVCFDMGVEMQACQMTVDLMDYDEDDFYDDVTVGVGAATALEQMADADIQLLV
jgi:peroxiredoxin family protein